jgi:hypothetical protein
MVSKNKFSLQVRPPPLGELYDICNVMYDPAKGYFTSSSSSSFSSAAAGWVRLLLLLRAGRGC